MSMIYFDNAATTYPKPGIVYEEMDKINRSLAFNAGRGSYALAKQSAVIIDNLRKELLRIVNAVNVAEVVLSASATFALNQIIGGLDIRPEQYIYISPYEHNAVVRTLYNQKVFRNGENNTHISVMPILPDGSIDMLQLLYEFSVHAPSFVFMSHVSNVTGYILPVEKIAAEAKKYNATVTIDGSQALGLVPFDMSASLADFYVFAGHKTLYGPFGVGGFFMKNGMKLDTFIAGGTGSDSLNVRMPDEGATRYEPASPNVVAAAGLLSAVKELTADEISHRLEYERKLTEYLADSMKNIHGIRLYLPPKESHVGIIAFNIAGYKASDIGMILDEDYNIAVRTGYHCAPFVHEYLDDREYLGVVRVSVSMFTTFDDADALVGALREI